MRSSSKKVAVALVLSALLACSGKPGTPGSGGAQAGGGTTGTPTGGSTTALGGAIVTSSGGGATGSGGTTATGGRTATGGIQASGGTGATGGITASGGTTRTSTGGAGTGGAAPGGATAATGGVIGSGGSPTGGTGGAGGSATGGASTATGGASTATGGTGAGGTTGRGGSATGGTSGGTGGSTGTSTCTTAATLKEAGACSGRLVGTALAASHLGEAAYAKNALEFSYVTPEDEMKWDATEATRNTFTFTRGDQIVDFAVKNGMKVKGHTLVWYNQLPSWVSGIASASELRQAMVSHIQGVMSHYQGKVIAWDVVNEAFSDDDGTQLRDSVFSRVLGKSYIDDAFKAARAADGKAKLFYNDFATDGFSAKANSVYELVKDLKARGIPIDGVGLQMHWRSVGSTLTAADVAGNMQRLVDLGVEVVLSEMDVQLCKGGTLTDQQARFHDIVAVCVAQPGCTAVTFWGITDKYSWLNSRTDLGCTSGETPRPLLLDDNYGKKLAYTGVMEALLGR